MRPLPAGRRVGGEAGVDHGDGCAVVRILQVIVEAAELSHKEHALVDDGPRYVDVLVDGTFQEAKKDNTLRWKGSSNQQVIDVQKTLKTGEVVLHG